MNRLVFMEKFISQQYDQVKDSRRALHDYCETFSTTELVKKLDTFNGGSIRNFLIHVVNVYEFWVGNFVLSKALPYTQPEAISSMEEIKRVYSQVDRLIQSFIQRYTNQWNDQLTGMDFRKERSITVTPLLLFTHVITHEFHHKGQILSMSRQFGYVPPDTDVIRFG